MIVGIGIDSVDIERCARWHMYQQKTLQRFFSSVEFEYCLSIPSKSAERFAVRFAAKEAFYKAFCMMNPQSTISFLQCARHVSVMRGVNGSPYLIIDWQKLAQQNEAGKYKVLFSCTHSKHVATAWVVIVIKPS